MQVGQVCIKTKGRSAGKKVVVLSKETKGSVVVAGKNVKKKKCNVMHLFPLKATVSIKADASQEEVVRALKE